MMNLAELSMSYRVNADALYLRIFELRQRKRELSDLEQARRLDRRIAELEPLLREARELSALTAHYYDRGYHKNEKYCF